MGQHRTKEQKMKAQIRREQMLYSLPDAKSKALGDTPPQILSKTPLKKDELQTASLHAYALKDLMHSAVSTFVIVVILLGTYLVLR